MPEPKLKWENFGESKWSQGTRWYESFLENDLLKPANKEPKRKEIRMELTDEENELIHGTNSS